LCDVVDVENLLHIKRDMSRVELDTRTEEYVWCVNLIVFKYKYNDQNVLMRTVTLWFCKKCLPLTR